MNNSKDNNIENKKINNNTTNIDTEKSSSSIFSKTVFVWIGALISCLLWGSAFPMIKLGYKEFDISSDEMAAQILFAGIRFVLAGILAVLLGCIFQKKLLFPKKGSIPLILKLSCFQTVGQYFFFYVGLAHTSGVRASIVQGTNVFIALIVACLIFKQETLSTKKIIGCIIGFAGVVLVNLTGNSLGGGSILLGDCFIILSTVAYAFSSVLLKEYTKKEDPVILSGYQFIAGGLIMIIAGLVMGGRIQQVTTKGIVDLIYLAFVSAAAYTLWGLLIKHNPVSKVAVFGFMTPVFGVITSLLLLDESSGFSLIHLVSLILVCIGIYIVNSSKEKTTS
ncbi:Permease of the drug/metabolite transporter (DMT) superfamily [Lachnospiraceae bacterium NE2001]|nr:Permease of the drug/metabolite transporter (DMT) superfamily [Lachnospiraceae bacterium NE2001]